MFVPLLGEMLAPVNRIHICDEQIAICDFYKVPLIEPEIVVNFDKPMRSPLADMGMGFRPIAYAVFGIALGAFAIARPEVLPTPTVRKIEFGKGHLQHDAMRKARQPCLATNFLGGTDLKGIVFAGEVFIKARLQDSSMAH
jgi:hypothetical protein